jgi:hypothetical protein
MAVYSTFFLCDPASLISGFPRWRPPLPQPVRREFKNLFTGKLTAVETREPDWSDESDPAPEREFAVVAIKGSYEDYLEGRLPPFVRGAPHWAANGITMVELGALAKPVDAEWEFESPLYAPPSAGAGLVELPAELISQVATQEEQGLKALAEQWAAAMSTPDYTHSVTGVRLSDGWTSAGALDILRPIAALAKQAKNGMRMYLLLEY